MVTKEDVMSREWNYKDAEVYEIEQGHTIARLMDDDAELGNLLAAAPDLLKACKAALSGFTDIRVKSPDIKKQLQQALKKAGE